MDKSFVAYMCKTAFEYDNQASDGTKVYPTEKTLRRYCTCVEECGVVRVRVSLEEVIQEGKI